MTSTVAMSVLGFIVQCETCPQKAVVATQPQAGWVCPRCVDGVEHCGKHTGIASNRCLLPEGHSGDCDCQTLKYCLDSDYYASAGAVETGHDMGLSHAAEMFPQHQKAPQDRRVGEVMAAAGICPHQAVRYGVCADCGHIPQYPWGAAIPAPDDDYPIGKVRG